MSYRLINKLSKETVDVVRFRLDSDEVARHYFIQKKQLSEKSFDKLFEVVKDKTTVEHKSMF